MSRVEAVGARYSTKQTVSFLKNTIGEYNIKSTGIIDRVDTTHLYAECDKSDTYKARFALLDYLQKLQCPPYQKQEPDVRQIQPESASILLKALLGGDKGLRLYKNAIEEESRDERYRCAVLEKSTSYHDGDPCIKRPVILVGGPSGCGKSYSSGLAVRVVSGLLPKRATLDSEAVKKNVMVCIDGGIPREVSQIRSLLIQIAIGQGYTGIRDLYSHNTILRNMKKHVYQSVVEKDDIGLIIPDTFAHWFDPFKKSTKSMEKLLQQPRTQLIFCLVRGVNPKTFRQVVAFMGSRRAWQTNGFDEKRALQLNGVSIPESKAYKPSGFLCGYLGSALAKKWFIQHSKAALTVDIINDLILLKPTSDKRAYVPDDDGTLMVSNRQYQNWLEDRQAPKPYLGTLQAYTSKSQQTCPITSREISVTHGMWYRYTQLGASPDIPLAEFVESCENRNIAISPHATLSFMETYIHDIITDEEMRKDKEAVWGRHVYPFLQQVLIMLKAYSQKMTDNNIDALYKFLQEPITTLIQSIKKKDDPDSRYVTMCQHLAQFKTWLPSVQHPLVTEKDSMDVDIFLDSDHSPQTALKLFKVKIVTIIYLESEKDIKHLSFTSTAVYGLLSMALRAIKNCSENMVSENFLFLQNTLRSCIKFIKSDDSFEFPIDRANILKNLDNIVILLYPIINSLRRQQEASSESRLPFESNCVEEDDFEDGTEWMCNLNGLPSRTHSNSSTSSSGYGSFPSSLVSLSHHRAWSIASDSPLLDSGIFSRHTDVLCSSKTQFCLKSKLESQLK